MEDERRIEDRLRAEYFELLPAMRRTLVAVETEISYMLLDVKLQLRGHEQIVVRGRVKDCESAVDSLRRRQALGAFDEGRSNNYSLAALPDLVGVRILVFPQRRLNDARRIVAPRISEWIDDPVPGPRREGAVALKYHGFWSQADSVRAEIQIVPLLVGLFWEVEHAAIYKPSPILRGLARSDAMLTRSAAVHAALREFEEEFERQTEGTST